MRSVEDIVAYLGRELAGARKSLRTAEICFIEKLLVFIKEPVAGFEGRCGGCGHFEEGKLCPVMGLKRDFFDLKCSFYNK